MAHPLVTTLRKLSRLDGWSNSNSGIGDPSWDRSLGSTFDPEAPLDWALLTSLFRFSGICRRVVSVFPQEALRRDPTYEGPEAEELTEEMSRLNVKGVIEQGLIWGRLYGGAVAVLVTDDGRPASEPLRDGAFPIHRIDLYDRREVEKEANYDSRHGAPYATANVFRIMPISGGTIYVHRSRCLLFGSVATDAFTKEGNGGWDDSALQAPFSTIRKFDAGYDALGNMLTDASQAVVKIAGLMAAVAEEDGLKILAKRAQVMTLGRSIAKALFLDADLKEEFQKVATSFAGVPDSIDRLAQRLAADTEIPVPILMGEAPAGLNATGDSTVRLFQGKCTSFRGVEVEPHFRKVVRLIAPGHKACWPPLWEPTEKERADTYSAVATADEKYILNGVVLPAEVSAERQGSPLFVKVDRSLRRQIPAPAKDPNAPAKTAPAAPPKA